MFCLQADETAVRLWSHEPLKHGMAGGTMRPALATALRKMAAHPTRILHCEHYTAREFRSDVENVLIYNVGESAFAKTSVNGIRFRLTRRNPMASPDGKHYRHLSEYRFVDTPVTPDAEPIRVQLSSPQDVFAVWLAAVNAAGINGQDVSGDFRLHVHLDLPEAASYAARIIKKLFDGLICAMHADAQPDLEAARRLATEHGIASHEIVRGLGRPPNPLLPISSEHRVVKPYRKRVKWNPADERCVEGTLICRRGRRCSATVYIAPSDRPLI